MSEKYNYRKKTTGIAFATLFAVASAMSSYATESTNDESDDATLDPIINVVSSNDLGSMDLVFTESDIANAQTISSLAGAVNGEYYMLIGSYEVCVLSNALIGDGTNGFSGILMKVAKSSTATFYKAGATGANPTTAGINQLALYNAATGKKIPFLLQVTPAGHTKSSDLFGSGAEVASGALAGQYAPVPFIIGGDAANMATTDVYLHDANVSTLAASSVSHENLALDVYGAVNHYGLNHDLQSGDITLATQSTMGLATSENHHLSGHCLGDQDPTDTVGSTAMKIVIKIYANAADMAMSPSGTYSTEYTIHWSDMNDQVATNIYDIANQGSTS